MTMTVSKRFDITLGAEPSVRLSLSQSEPPLSKEVVSRLVSLLGKIEKFRQREGLPEQPTPHASTQILTLQNLLDEVEQTLRYERSVALYEFIENSLDFICLQLEFLSSGRREKDVNEDIIKEVKEEKGDITIELFQMKYRARIDMIGEHFLKAKILELIALKADFMTVELIIENRTKELDILNQIRKQKLDDQNRKPKS